MNAILDTWKEARELGQSAIDDPNFASENQEKYMDRITAKLETLKATMAQVWTDMMSNPAVNAFLDVLIALSKVLTTLTGLFNGLGNAMNAVFGNGVGSIANIGALIGLVTGGVGAFKGYKQTHTLKAALDGAKSPFIELTKKRLSRRQPKLGANDVAAEIAGNGIARNAEGNFSVNRNKSFQGRTIKDATSDMQKNTAEIEANTEAKEEAVAVERKLGKTVVLTRKKTKGQSTTKEVADNAVASAKKEFIDLTNANERLNSVANASQGESVTSKSEGKFSRYRTKKGRTAQYYEATPDIDPIKDSLLNVNDFSKKDAKELNKKGKDFSNYVFDELASGINPDSIQADHTIPNKSKPETAPTKKKSPIRNIFKRNKNIDVADDLSNAGESVNKMSRAMSGLSNVASGAFSKIKNFATAFAPEIGFGLAFAGYNALDKAIQGLGITSAEAMDNVKTQNQTFAQQRKEMKVNKDTVTDLGEEFERLSKGVTSAGANVSLTNNDYERYLEISDEMAEILPDLVRYYDDYGHAILNASTAEELNAAFAKLEAKQADERLNGMDMESIDAVIDFMNGTASGGQVFKSNWNKMLHGEAQMPNVEKLAEALYEVQDIATSATNYGYYMDKLMNDGNVTMVDKNQRTYTRSLGKPEQNLIRSLIGKADDTKWTDKDTLSLQKMLADNDLGALQDQFYSQYSKEVGVALRNLMSDRLKVKLQQKNDKDFNTLFGDTLEDMISFTPDSFLRNTSNGMKASEHAEEYIDHLVSQITDDNLFASALNRATMKKNRGGDTAVLDYLLAPLVNGRSVASYLAQKSGFGMTEDDILKQFVGDMDVDHILDARNEIFDKIAVGGTMNPQANLTSRKRIRDENSLTRSSKARYKNNERLNKLLQKQGTNTEAINKWLLRNNAVTEDALDKVNAILDTAIEIGNTDPFAYLRQNFDYAMYDPKAYSEHLGDLFSNLAVVEETRKKLNEAWKESYSAGGLTSEKYDTIRNHAQSVYGMDYDDNKLFEKTAGGLRLDPAEWRKLNSDYRNKELDKYRAEMEKLQRVYQRNREGLYDLDPTDTKGIASKEAEAQSIRQQMRDLDSYKAIINGEFSKVNQWSEGLSLGEAGDTYDAIVKDMKETEEMWGKGLHGTNKVRNMIDMFTNEDLSNKDSVEVGKYYDGAMNKAKKWFTEDGSGAETLLQDISNLNAEWASFDSATGDWTLDLPDEGVLAKALGIDESLIDVMIGKLRDYGAILQHVNESELEQDFRLKAKKTAETLSDEEQQKYQLGGYANEDVTGIGDDGSVKDVNKLTEAQKNYGKALQDVDKEINDLLDQKEDGIQVDDAHLKKLQEVQEALRAEKEYIDEVKHSEEERQRTYKTEEGKRVLNDSIHKLSNSGYLSKDFGVNWDADKNASYYEDRMGEVQRELAESNILVGGKLDFSQVDAESKQQIETLIHGLNLQIQDKLHPKIQMPEIEGASEEYEASISKAVEQYNQLLGSMNEKAALKADMDLNVDVDPNQVTTVENNIRTMISNLETTLGIDIPAEVEQESLEGNVKAIHDWLTQNEPTMQFAADMGVVDQEIKERLNPQGKIDYGAGDVTPPPLVQNGVINYEYNTNGSPEANAAMHGFGTPMKVMADVDWSNVGVNPPQVKADVSVDQSQVQGQIQQAVSGITANVDLNLNTAKVDSYKPKNKKANVNFGAETSKVDAYTPGNKTAKVDFSPNTALIDNFKNSLNTPSRHYVDVYYREHNKPTKAGAFGTARTPTLPLAFGTANAFGSNPLKGNAFAKGSMSVGSSGRSLVGELGR